MKALFVALALCSLPAFAKAADYCQGLDGIPFTEPLRSSYCDRAKPLKSSMK
jgi:hypothetical protein